MEKITYTNDELKALALEALKGDTKTEALYGYNDGTFLNEDQYKKQLKDAVDKSDTALESETRSLFKIVNPNVKKSETDKEKDKQIKELMDQIASIVDERDALRKDVLRLTDVVEENDGQISSLKSELTSTKDALSDATARLANADETFAAMKSEADEAKAKITELTASNKDLAKQLKAATSKKPQS